MIQIKLVGTDSVEVEDVQPEKGKTAHILIPAYPNNDYADIRPAALLELTPGLAKRLIKRMEGVRKLANELDDETRLDEAVYFDYTPTWIDRSTFYDFGSEELDILDEHLEEPMLLTEEQAKQVKECPSAEVRVEISRLHVSSGSTENGDVYWTMRPKYADYIVDSSMIPESVLQRVADTEQ